MENDVSPGFTHGSMLQQWVLWQCHGQLPGHYAAERDALRNLIMLASKQGANPIGFMEELTLHLLEREDVLRARMITDELSLWLLRTKEVGQAAWLEKQANLWLRYDRRFAEQVFRACTELMSRGDDANATRQALLRLAHRYLDHGDCYFAAIAWETVRAKWGQSALSAEEQYQLARFRQVARDWAGCNRPAEALQEYQILLDSYPDFPQRDEAYFGAIRNLMLGRRRAEAEQMLAKMEGEGLKGAAWQSARRFISTFEGP
jgi:hypothetical protein